MNGGSYESEKESENNIRSGSQSLLEQYQASFKINGTGGKKNNGFSQ